jgi:POT family proton-dependent oligopeptide transporter
VAGVAIIWGLIQFQDVIQTLLIVSGVAMLGFTLIQAVFKLPYGDLSRAPQGRVITMSAGLIVLLLSMLGFSSGYLAPNLAYAGMAFGALLILFVCWSEKRAIAHHPRDRLFAILFLIALNPLFWGLFEQAGGSLNLYTDKFVDKGGVPTSLFQSINPIYIVMLAPIFAALWQWLGKKGLEPSAPAKFALALFQVGLGFLVFVWGAQAVGPAVMTPVLFVFLIYLLHTTGELCLSPVGLSAMARLSPLHLMSFIMGAWFYMTAVGNFVAGKIGEATGGEGGEMSKELTLTIYSQIGWITIGVSVVVLAFSPIVKKWMHLDTLEDRDERGLAGQEEIGEPQAAGMHPARD